MILRGISSPVQGGDAANKEYVDGLINTPQLTIVKGDVVAKAYALNFDSGDNNGYCLVPLVIEDNSAYFYVNYFYNGGVRIPVSKIINKKLTSVAGRLFENTGSSTVTPTTNGSSIGGLKPTNGCYSGILRLYYE